MNASRTASPDHGPAATPRAPAAGSAEAPFGGESERAARCGGAGPVDVCPRFHTAVELVGKRWSGAILRALMERPLRFAELAQSVPGLSDRLLSQRVKELEAAGLVARTVEPGAPVRVSYALTEQGAELRPILEQLGAWAQRWSLGDC